MKNPRFDVFSSAYARWYWRLIARNGEIIANSEGYTTRRDALRAVEAVKRAVFAIDAREVAEMDRAREAK